MSKIAEQIQLLRDKEKSLQRETLKIEFLNHILSSASNYDHVEFNDVKQEVVVLLGDFVAKVTKSIEDGTKFNLVAEQEVTKIESVVTPPAAATTAPVTVKKPVDEVSPHEKLSFALENRHLAGRKVSVSNDKNMTISGNVVGLDAPFVIVKTETGPVIKVPLALVSMS